MASNHKTGVLFLTCSLIFSSLHAQFNVTMQTGWAFATHENFITPGCAVKFAGFSVGAVMNVNIKRDSPADFGMHVSYTYKCIEAGAARYYSLYSLDAYDKFKNKWNSGVFIAGHYNKWFLQYEYLRGNRFSIGVTENFSEIIH